MSACSHTYRVRVYVGTVWSFLTQGDHYEDFEMESTEPLEKIARRLASEGFRAGDKGRWIMPGAILEVRVVK